MRKLSIGIICFVTSICLVGCSTGVAISGNEKPRLSRDDALTLMELEHEIENTHINLEV